MKNDKKFALIGPGVMAEAIIEGLIRESVIPAGKIIAAGPRQERLDELNQRYEIGRAHV